MRKKKLNLLLIAFPSALSANDSSKLLENIRVNTQRVFNATEEQQQPHVDQTPQIDRNKWVINLSSWSFSDAEVALLQKGLNFAVMPTNILATEILTKVELAIRMLDSE